MVVKRSKTHEDAKAEEPRLVEEEVPREPRTLERSRPIDRAAAGAVTRVFMRTRCVSHAAAPGCQHREMAGTAGATVAGECDLEAVRRRGFGVAYRMLGSVAEAEDVAQDAMMRLAQADEPIREPLAWVTTVATRLSINVLRLARTRRERYVGP